MEAKSEPNRPRPVPDELSEGFWEATRGGQLAIWGETAQRRAAPRRQQPAEAAKRTRPHPFAASLDEFIERLSLDQSDGR